MASLALVRSLNPYAHSFLFLFLALSPLMFLGVEGQTRCYIRNRCVNGDIAPSPIECCAKKIPDIQRDCGDRNSENCNVYFTVGGGNCTPCFYIGFQHSRIILNETGLQTIPIFVSSFGSIPSFLITANILYTNATDNVDYTFMQQYFYYPNREPFDTNIDINIRNDNVALETVEEVFLGLMMNIGYIFGQHYTTIYIKDNDVLTLSVSPTFLQVSESSIVSFAVSKDKVTAVPVNITVTPLTYQQYSNKTATNNNLPSLSSITNAPSNPAEEQDFDSAIVQLSLDTSIGAFSVSMNELVNDDNIVEDPEGLILLIESTNPDSRIRFNTQIVVIQINSDDSLVLSFDQSRLQLSENSNSVSLNIMQQTGVVSELDLSTLILSYQTIPSLIGDVVFSPPGNLVFNREGTSLNMTAIYHKTIRENQNYVIHFQPVNNRTGVQFYPTNTVELILTSNKKAEVKFAMGQATFSEGGGNQSITVILGGAQLGQSEDVEVYIDDGTTNGTSLGFVTFGTGAIPQNRTVVFPVVDNNIALEPDKLYLLRLRNIGNIVLGYPGTMNVTVEDDDGAFLSLERRLYAVTEDVKSIGICVTLTRGVISSPLYIFIIDVGGTATYPVDYLFYDIRLQMPPYQNSTCATLYIVDDDTKERRYEEFYMYIFRVFPRHKNLLVNNSWSTVRIQDDDISIT